MKLADRSCLFDPRIERNYDRSCVEWIWDVSRRCLDEPVMLPPRIAAVFSPRERKFAREDSEERMNTRVEGDVCD